MANTDFHFLLLAAGEVIRERGEVNAITLQNFMTEDPAFGYRPTLQNCRLALFLLKNSGFIQEITADQYIRA